MSKQQGRGCHQAHACQVGQCLAARWANAWLPGGPVPVPACPGAPVKEEDALVWPAGRRIADHLVAQCKIVVCRVHKLFDCVNMVARWLGGMAWQIPANWGF